MRRHARPELSGSYLGPLEPAGGAGRCVRKCCQLDISIASCPTKAGEGIAGSPASPACVHGMWQRHNYFWALLQVLLGLLLLGLAPAVLLQLAAALLANASAGCLLLAAAQGMRRRGG